MKANKDNIIFISAGSGFFRDGATCEGYRVMKPYVERNIIDRVLREICFRLPFFPSDIWYNKRICKEKAEFVIVSDTLITVDFLKWIKRIFPHAQCNYTYGNMVGRARHILPDKIPAGWRIWTYDDHDARFFGLHLYHDNAYPKAFLKPQEPIEYDVLFVGADKGRGEYLLQLEKKMNLMGLKTKFIIAPDGRFSKKKSYYQKPIPYREVVDLIVKSKSILNVAMEGQEGMTMRDLESMFFGVKLLTTNKNVVNFDMYYPENVYIINGLNIDDLPAFLGRDMVIIPENLKKKHSIEHYIETITEA